MSPKPLTTTGAVTINTSLAHPSGATESFNGLTVSTGTVPTTCAEAGTGSPTCAFTSSAGDKTQKITLASSAAATSLTVTFAAGPASMHVCYGFDFTIPGTRILQTGGSATTAVMTYYSLAGAAANPGATDVLYLSCDGN